MGGLVIKKAFILARQFEEFKSIADRIRSIFFIATPHRGSDLAQTLSKVLAVVPGARPFVNDLNRNSVATQSINDEFPQHCQNLQLYSFYETIPMNYGFGKGLIVDKDLATLGYSNERTAYLNANHREVVKFDSAINPNYLAVRNSLASVIGKIKEETFIKREEIDNEVRQRFDAVLGVSDAPVDDLARIDALRMEGSCYWIFEKDEFQRWRDSSASQIYWVSAQPAAGKSVLAGSVISHLRGLGCECFYYFFDNSDKLKSTIHYFLRSMIWQIASHNSHILKIILRLCEKGDEFPKMDHRTIWRRLFLEGLFKLRLDGPQYWVVDGLDECKSDLELVSLLLKIGEIKFIRLFITCRNTFDAYRQTTHPKTPIVSQALSVGDTQKDIELYIQANMELLPLVDEKARNTIVAQILSKSAGCFLWVNLVLQELRQVHTSGERRQVLEDVPSGMDDLYSRIVDSMSKATYGNKLAKAILTWTVCSVRPLTMTELHYALELNMEDTIDNLQKSLLMGCGHLVSVDIHSRVQMIHQTARDFLLRPNNPSEFAIDKKTGHKSILMTCLQYLLSEEMKGPRYRRLSVDKEETERSEFVRYACSTLSNHITHVDSADDECLITLGQFLSSYNILSWIEYIAQHLDLSLLIQTGKAMKDYLHRRSKHKSLLGKEVTVVDSWSTDLIRLVTKFGKHLSGLPASVYQLIPPFCPKQSAIKRQFASYTRGFAVDGLSAENWDDCLSAVVYQHDTPVALATSERFFAVGLSAGSVRIYYNTTCQEVRAFQHGESVRILEFGDLGNILVSAGFRKVCVWNLCSWENLWTFDLPTQCMSLVVEDDEQLMIGAFKHNNLIYWDLTIGEVLDSIDWTQDIAEQSSYAISRPTGAAFGLELNLLAVLYRGQDILLWDLKSCTMYESFAKDGVRSGGNTGSTTVWSIVFSPAPATALLAAGYSDGDLVLFDVSMGTVKEMTVANAQTLTSSPDGFTLASADSSGTIQIYEFESLRLLYRINSAEEFSIRSLAFSADCHHLLDIRGSVCRAWDPVILSRQELEEENSDTISISTAPPEIRLDDSEEIVMITALCCPSDSNVFFAGKDDGSVSSYDANNGEILQTLFNHSGNVSIVLINYEQESNMLSTIDSSSRVILHKILPKNRCYDVAETMIDYRTGIAVNQILVNKGHSRLLVSCSTEDKMWSIAANGSELIRVIPWKESHSHAWKSHPTEPGQLLLITRNVLHIYDWNTFERLTGNEGILLEGSILPDLAIKSIVPCFNGKVLATEFLESLSIRSKSRVLMWHTKDLNINASRATSIPEYQPLTDQVACHIGAYKDKLVFLHSNGWVCSADSASYNLSRYVRHFFVPADWLSNSSELMIQMSGKGNIIFVKGSEVAVIRRGLEINEYNLSASVGNRPSLASRKKSSSPFRERLSIGRPRRTS